MYRFYIDSNIQTMAGKFSLNPLFNAVKIDLQSLKINLESEDLSFVEKAKGYVQSIIDHLDSLVVASSNTFEIWDIFFGKKLPQDLLKTSVKSKFRDSEKTGEFVDLLIGAMDYGRFKKTLYECFANLGVETCVYCNMQEATSSDSGEANYQLEHFWPKKLYPFLSCSFFNFFPSCSTCNQKKGWMLDKQGFDLYMYSLQCNRNPFLFNVPNAVLLYKKSDEEFLNDVNIEFSSPSGYANNQITKLEIQSRYNKNKVRRKLLGLLKRYDQNSPTQIRVTSRTFPRLFPLTLQNIEKVYVDYYQEKDIHREPYTKLFIDFGKQIGIL